MRCGWIAELSGVGIERYNGQTYGTLFSGQSRGNCKR